VAAVGLAGASAGSDGVVAARVSVGCGATKLRGDEVPARGCDEVEEAG
jgi:hypothetical protein